MTLPDKQNEALARLVGWMPSRQPIFNLDWFREGGGLSKGPPDMATPEGANELLELCKKHGLCVRICCYPPNDKWEVSFHSYPLYCNKYLPKAVVLAVYAAYKGGYLTGKEPTDGKKT